MRAHVVVGAGIGGLGAALALSRTGHRVTPIERDDTPLPDSAEVGGLINRLRSFVDADGRPRVTGLHALGDAHTTTNPLYGRGCSLAMVQAVLRRDSFLADVLAGDPRFVDAPASVRTGRAAKAAARRAQGHHPSVERADLLRAGTG